ncbi:MAG: tRNA pseudouridine(55) synthase TruB [Lachnospiraceae bacterium]|nr:tRNA pseudouridine(55) synthase TruB [Lachnospiraceae bacterium]
MIDGMIAVWKEKDFTSHDVVAKMRGILRQKKIGHTGTLDPKAEGVLVVGLGMGTRACDLLPDKTKTYEAEMLLGVETDTEDIWGTVLREEDVCVSSDAFCDAILSFQGTYLQTPPMYSAKKINGQKLYDLARKGKIVERSAVPVTIHQIQIRKLEGNRAAFSVTCSAGTYIRTLCVDIGKKLGVPAVMTALTRTDAGGFTSNQALTLKQMEEARDNGTLLNHVIPVDQALTCYPMVTVGKAFGKQLKNGNSFLESALTALPDQDSEYYRVYLEEDGFIGVFRRLEDKRTYKPHKMFLSVG